MGPESKEPSPQSAGNYLYDVLADGARPFRFRGGVSSLLGVSAEGSGFIKLPPTFHPLGFIHRQRAGGRSAIPDLRLLASARRMSLSAVVQGNEPCGSCLEACEIAQSVSVNELQEKTLPKRSGGNIGVECEHPAVAPEKTVSGVVSRRIEIPGATDKKVTFHHLSALSEDQPEQAEVILRERNSSPDIRRPLEKESHNEQRRAGDAIERGGTELHHPDGADNCDGAKRVLHMKKPERATSSAISNRMDITCDDMTIKKALLDTSGIKPDRLRIPGTTDNKVITSQLSMAPECPSSPSILEDDPEEGMSARRMRGVQAARESMRYEQLLSEKSSTPSHSMDGKGISFMNGGEPTISASSRNIHEKREKSSSEVERPGRTMPVMKPLVGIREEAHLGKAATDSQEHANLSEHFQQDGTLVGRTEFNMQNNFVAQHGRDMACILNTLENHLRQKIDQLRDDSKKRPVIGEVGMEDKEKGREQEQVREKQMPPQQRIVVVRHSSRRNSAPAAFWERSYLGRFRLRPLR